MIPLQAPKVDDETAFQSETLRVYDICNGCRRCFNLCPSFDVLFNGLDQVDGEADALEPKLLGEVVDLCYYCKLCFNHCPYCPPHHYDLDFPRLMLWGKYHQAKKRRPSLRDRLLVRVELMGRLGGLAAPLANWALKLRPVRWLMEVFLGIHRERLLPSFHRRDFSSWFKRSQPLSISTGSVGSVGSVDSSGQQAKNTDEKVALFYTCYVNYHDPEIGRAAVQVLQKNGVQVTCPQQQCCGMPYFDIGDLDTVRKKAEVNLKTLGEAVDAGYKIVAPVPTCSLMIKKEYPDLVPTETARKVAANTLDLCEYLMVLEKQGKLCKDFVWSPGTVAYQVPCHLRDQNIGFKSRDLMRLIPGTQVQLIEKCSGHDGAFGTKKEYYPLSLEVGRKAFSAVENADTDITVSDCPLSGLALTQSTGKKSIHPIEVIKRAYGI